jgi:RNA polymerase sigma-70 factor (ECF subfamily)
VTTTIDTSDVSEDRFDVDLIMERALAADEADLAAHGRLQPTLADVAETAYRAFEIGVWEISRDRHAEALTWLSTAVDSGIEEARPLLAICRQVIDPIPERRAAAADEQDERLAEELISLEEEPSEACVMISTPIYEAVLAHAHAAARTGKAQWWGWAGMTLPAREDAVDRHAGAQLVHRRIDASNHAMVWCPDLALFHDPLCAPSGVDRDGPGPASLCPEWTMLQIKWRSPEDTAFGFRKRLLEVLPQGSLSRVTPVSPAADTAARTTDINLLACDAADGDSAAIGAVLELMRPLVVRYCRARIGGRDLAYLTADDVAQEVCLSVLKILPNYRKRGGSFLRLVYAIAANKVTDAVRAVARDSAEPIADVPGLGLLGRPGADAGVRLDLGSRLGRMLAVLPQAHQEVLTLRIAVGLSATETAEALGVSAGNVRVTQHRALTRLRGMLREERC